MSEEIKLFRELIVTYEKGENQLFLRGPVEVSFQAEYQGNPAKITIEQFALGRTVKVVFRNYVPHEYLDTLLYLTEQLLMIIEGSFLPLQDATYLDLSNGNQNDISVFNRQFKSNRLSYFVSDKIASSSDVLLNYEDVLNEKLFAEWMSVCDVLKYANQIYLYFMGKSGLPVDLRVSFLIEMMEPISEMLVEKNIIPVVDKGEGRYAPLRNCLKSVIDKYGQIIFWQELNSGNYEKFLTCTVNTRRNIMHVKNKRSVPSYDGKTSVAYIWKFSLMYQIIILDLIGVENSKYVNRLKKIADTIDQWIHDNIPLSVWNSQNSDKRL